jgi:1,4-alpha-glucan branching enzyme
MMGWINHLNLFQNIDPIYRKFHQNEIACSLGYAFTEEFTSIHDEVCTVKLHINENAR